jgi:hypothetical protein
VEVMRERPNMAMEGELLSTLSRAIEKKYAWHRSRRGPRDVKPFLSIIFRTFWSSNFFVDHSWSSNSFVDHFSRFLIVKCESSYLSIN